MARSEYTNLAPQPFRLEAPPVHLTVDLGPFMKLINEFLGLRCAPDILAMGLFPNGKEITESMSAYAAVRRVLGQERFADPEIRLFDVGAGGTPRTAGLFAFRSRWRCTAVDPRLNAERWAHRIDRVVVVKQPIEALAVDHPGTAVVAMVHAHVAVLGALKSLRADRLIVVAMPCCMDLSLPVAPHLQYEDLGCWSPKRTVRVWDLDRDAQESLIPRPAPADQREEG